MSKMKVKKEKKEQKTPNRKENKSNHKTQNSALPIHLVERYTNLFTDNKESSPCSIIPGRHMKNHLLICILTDKALFLQREY